MNYIRTVQQNALFEREGSKRPVLNESITLTNTEKKILKPMQMTLKEMKHLCS